MDPITHGLVGALVARLSATEKLGASATAVGAACAAAPDVDYVLLLAGSSAYYCHHREATHSLVGGLVLATVVAALVNAAREKKAFGAYWLVGFAAFLSHVLLDALTPFGTALLWPFSQVRVAWDALFWVDPWLSFIVFAAFAVGFSPRLRARASLFGLALVIGYVGGCIAVRQLALAKTREEAKEVIGVQSVSALPVPFLPFSWHGVVEARSAYYVFEVRGAKATPIRVATKALESRWVRSVKEDPVLAPWFRVARFPLIEDHVDEGGHHIEAHDLQHVLATGRVLFPLKVEIDETDTIVEFHVPFKADGEEGK